MRQLHAVQVPSARPVAPILVGVDGSGASRAALRWAYAHAERVGSPVEVVTAWTAGHLPADAAQDDAQTIADESVAAALSSRRRGLTVVTPEGRPADVLLSRAVGADLVVLGPHVVHSVGERSLGMTSARVLAAAACPVAVVDIDADSTLARQRIVVGVDGSRAAQAALIWATRLARLTDAKVDALLVWGSWPGYAVQAEDALLNSVMALPEHLRGVVRTETIRDRPADALVDAGRSADMIVVGTSRGGHHLPRVLGSVSRHVVLRANVPVIVTPGPAPLLAAAGRTTRS